MSFITVRSRIHGCNRFGALAVMVNSTVGVPTSGSSNAYYYLFTNCTTRPPVRIRIYAGFIFSLPFQSHSISLLFY